MVNQIGSHLCYQYLLSNLTFLSELIISCSNRLNVHIMVRVIFFPVFFTLAYWPIHLVLCCYHSYLITMSIEYIVILAKARLLSLLMLFMRLLMIVYLFFLQIIYTTLSQSLDTNCNDIKCTYIRICLWYCLPIQDHGCILPFLRILSLDRILYFDSYIFWAFLI